MLLAFFTLLTILLASLMKSCHDTQHNLLPGITCLQSLFLLIPGDKHFPFFLFRNKHASFSTCPSLAITLGTSPHKRHSQHADEGTSTFLHLPQTPEQLLFMVSWICEFVQSIHRYKYFNCNKSDMFSFIVMPINFRLNLLLN